MIQCTTLPGGSQQVSADALRCEPNLRRVCIELRRLCLGEHRQMGWRDTGDLFRGRHRCKVACPPCWRLVSDSSITLRKSERPCAGMASKVDHPTVTGECDRATHVPSNGTRQGGTGCRSHSASSPPRSQWRCRSQAARPSRPLSRTSAGAQHQIWTGRQREFVSVGVSELGVPCLLNALQQLLNDEPMIQKMLQAGPCWAYVHH